MKPAPAAPQPEPSLEESCLPCQPGGTRGGTDLSGFGFRIGISLAFAGQGMIFGLGYNNSLRSGDAPAPFSTLYWVLHGGLILSAMVVVLILGRPLLRQTVEAIARRRISVEALFVLSACGAFAGSLISTLRGSGSVYYEVVSIVLCVYAIGKQIGVVQKGRVAQALSSFRHAFDTAVVEDAGGRRSRREVTALRPGERVLVQPGDPVPVDGRIASGRGYLRETTLTGEPAPVVKGPGDPVLAGTWSLDANLVIEPKSGRRRTIDGILSLLESSPGSSSRLQESADQLMQFFVPLVSLVAAGTFTGWLIFSSQPWWDALFNAMAVLLVACPCALGLAMPAGIWGGLYHLSQRGLVGRNGQLLDTLAEAGIIVFDKTGTLSRFELEADTSGLDAEGTERQKLLAAVASLGQESPHPVSAALAALARPQGAVRNFTVFPGQGMGGEVDGQACLVGEVGLLEEKGIPVPSQPPHKGKPVHVACNGRYSGFVLLQEQLRPEAAEAIRALQQLGCECRILSGDPAPSSAEIAGVPVHGGLRPDEKARLVRQWSREGKRILFIGDGINDLPAMEASDSALAIDLGAALATEFADGLLSGGRIGVLPSAIRHARRLKHSLRGNLRFALSYNLIGMGLAASGFLHPVVAAVLMVGSSAIVSLRAMRAAGMEE